MKILLRRFCNLEQGQALAIVLGLLAIGSLTIAVTVNHASTSLKAGGIAREDMEGFYAASSGVEYAIWALKQAGTTDNQTPDIINQMPVGIQIEDEGTYTLLLTGLNEPESGVHLDWIDLASTIELVSGNTSKFTISVNRTDEAVGNIKLTELGAVLPQNYTYVNDSPAGFPDNISTDNPDSTGNTTWDSIWIKWEWPPGSGPLVSGNHTQSFYVDGIGTTNGAYSWVQGQSNDIGLLGEITGELYRITSTAIRPQDGKITTEITADVIIMGPATYIFSYEVSN